MEVPLFQQVDDLVRAMTPVDTADVKTKVGRRGIKVWFDSDKPGREHYEAQMLSRRHVDGAEGSTVEIGFHLEHPDSELNKRQIEYLVANEPQWRPILGPEAEAGTFFGSEIWRRISEVWIEPDLDNPDVSFEIATRLVDYLSALEPIRQRKATN